MSNSGPTSIIAFALTSIGLFALAGFSAFGVMALPESAFVMPILIIGGVASAGICMILAGTGLEKGDEREQMHISNPLEAIMSRDFDTRDDDSAQVPFADSPDDMDNGPGFIATLLGKADSPFNNENAASKVISPFDKPFSRPDATPPQPDDPTLQYSDTVVLELLNLALERDRIDIFAQPIVQIPARHIEAFEFYGRIRAKPGVYIPGAKYRDIAKNAKLLTDIDNRVLLKSLETLRAEISRNLSQNKSKSFFINIAETTLLDQRFMHTLLQFLGRYRHLASLIVLEMSERDIKALPGKAREILNGLRDIGCRLSLSNISGPDIDIDWLTDNGIGYLRLPAPFIARHIRNNPEAADNLSIAIHTLDEKGIAVIADYVENNEDLAEILELPITKAQGYLLGRPDTPGVYNIRLAA